MKIKLWMALFAAVILMGGCNNKVEEKPVVKVEEGKIAPAIEVGQPFQPAPFKDQFGNEGSVTEDTQTVIMVFSKSTGHLVKEFIEQQPDTYLKEHHAIFVADVSKMPSLIFKYAALPDLQKHNYPIYLILDEEVAQNFKNEKYSDYVMVIDLDHGTVQAVTFVTTEKALEEAID